MYKTSCKYCGYSWIPRKPKPLSCPICHRYDLDRQVITEDVSHSVNPISIINAEPEQRQAQEDEEVISF